MSRPLQNQRVKFVLSKTNATIFIDGERFYSDSSKSNFSDIIELLSNWKETKRNVNKLSSFFISPEMISEYIGDELILDDDMSLSFREYILPSYFYKLILSMMENDFDIGILIRLLENIYRSDVDTGSILQFIDGHNMSITPDGCFLRKLYKETDTIVVKIHPSDITSCNGDFIDTSDDQLIGYARSDSDINIYNGPSVFIDDNYDNIYKIHTGDIL